ncbi:histidine kinase [Malaciobacter mytili LMG 24559]|uniref:histidine kinase n=1 Tax=Malaciobacter mytili LMG 24559 TaxID=1032238 RepID=A0AAX2ADM9_9BACT|nr:HAMP domain-containing sensor histidine kinase [Malaciobacter mytili]AXH16063.1 signal transduction sensor histidine kinase [Malaciobacter mytili LMG 24559]RXK14993.1 histidine kinase [Malaciobacter mytili LMG 24559]
MRQTNLDDFLNLEEQNKELEEKIKQVVKKNKQSEEILFQQSKMASMGELLGSITHQWRQPLMEINSLFMPIDAKLKMGQNVENKEILDSIEKLSEITKYMSTTINDFKNFFSTDKQKVTFNLSTQLNFAINILSSTLKKHNIKLEIIVKKNPEIYGYKNEYSQVLINLINNAKEILFLRNIKDPLIKITLNKESNNAILIIEDNAGGIKDSNPYAIFEPFYTKEKKDGFGIGLFMSKLIIEKHMNGYIEVVNGENGAIFTIVTPLNTDL